MLSAVLFGILKHHFLLSQASVSNLPGLLRDQIGEMRASLSHGVAGALGLGNVDGFVSSIGARLDAAGATLEVPEEAAAMPAAQTGAAGGYAPLSAPKPLPAVPPPPVAAAPAPMSASAPLRARAQARPQKSSKKWVWLLFAVLAGILALVYYRGFTQKPSVDLNESAGTPVATVTQPAPEAPAQVAAFDDRASAPIAASASAPASTAASTAAPVAASGASASTADWKDAPLAFSVSNAGVPSVQATVGTEAEKQQLIDTLNRRFPNGYSANISVVPTTRPATWLSRLKALAPLMAVPGAEAKLIGSKVELSGVAADSKLGWTDRLNKTLGGMFQVSSFDVDSAVGTATQSFRGAMKSLLATDEACSGDKLAKVLDLQVVNFARSSAALPEGAVATLGETAQLLKSCAAKGSMVKLEVAGYSDGVGSAPAKMEMSKERAAAVRAFLVKNGVPPQSLTAMGYGDANPVADNETASGRFANRRIEFVVK